MPLKEDIARLMMQEQELRFRSFDEAEAFALGTRLRSLALERTLPIVIDALRRDGRLKPGVRSLLIGFGVGLSWAGCAWTETWRG